MEQKQKKDPTKTRWTETKRQGRDLAAALQSRGSDISRESVSEREAQLIANNATLTKKLEQIKAQSLNKQKECLKKQKLSSQS
jgi:hypothetical protein